MKSVPSDKCLQMFVGCSTLCVWSKTKTECVLKLQDPQKIICCFFLQGYLVYETLPFVFCFLRKRAEKYKIHRVVFPLDLTSNDEHVACNLSDLSKFEHFLVRVQVTI